MDGVKLNGRFYLVKKNQDGKVLLAREGKNLVVTTGLTLMALLLTGAGTAPSHAAIGSDGSAVATGQTALQGTEHERVALATSTSAGNEYTATATFGSTLVAAKSVAEIGIFNAAAAGTMFSRFLPSTFDIQVGETVDLTWVLEIT